MIERLNKLTKVSEKFYNIQYAIRKMRKLAMQEDETVKQAAERVDRGEEEIEAAFKHSYYRLIAIEM